MTLETLVKPSVEEQVKMIPDGVPVFHLDDEELFDIDVLLTMLCVRYQNSESEEFLSEVVLYAHQLPRRLRKFLYDFRTKEPSASCVIKGYKVDDEAIGPTPETFFPQYDVSPTMREEFLQMLISSLIGELFGWNSQMKDRYLIHNLLPVKGHEKEQLGSGSEELLLWHSEDAFHPYRCDYLGFFCFRNHEKVATTYASIDQVDLSQLTAAERKILFEKRFFVEPDVSHFADSNLLGVPGEEVQRMRELVSQPLAALYGDRNAPYMNLDPFFMTTEEGDDEARAALDKLEKMVDEQMSDLILQPGDIAFIDNYKAVHGRKPFKARYDGKDRWMKRVYLTRDLRRSRDVRATVTSRILY